MTKRSASEWRTLFNEHTQSGQSAAAFCRVKGLCPKYFSLRRRQLLADNDKSLSAAFVPVAINPSTSAPTLELHCNDKLRLRIPITVSAHWLAELVQHLQA